MSESHPDLKFIFISMLAFEESDLIDNVAHRGWTVLCGEILDCDSTTVVGEKPEHR